MAEYIGCRKCDSHDCKGCNLKNLEMMLNNSKFDYLMNENRCINPAADVAPVVHGEWEQRPNGEVVCSKCGALVAVGNGDALKEVQESQHFCFNCGAKMDGELNE